MTYTLLGEPIDADRIVNVNRIFREPEDPDSRIYPFKIMHCKQPYETENLNLVYSNAYGPETETAFWTNFYWGKAIKAGRSKTDVPYSGKYDCIETQMYWPTTYIDVPADEVLQCESCHAKNGRLVALSSFYLPDRDSFQNTEGIGLGLLPLATIGETAAAYLKAMITGYK